MSKEKWYRTGAAAKEIGCGVSPYKLRALARSDAIENRSINGMIYIPEWEIARLKNGIPPIPAKTVDDTGGDEEDHMDTEAVHHQAASAGSPGGPVFTQTSTTNRAELYAEPSPELAKDREKVIRLQNKAQAKTLQREIREGDRIERERLAELAQEKRAEKWRQENLDYAMGQLPEGCDFAGMHSKVVELLSKIRPEHPKTRKWIDEIVEQTRWPIRRREEQARAIDETITFNLCRRAKGTDWEAEARANAKEAVSRLSDPSFDDMCAAAGVAVTKVNLAFEHQQKIEREADIRSYELGDGANSMDCEEASYLARCALQVLIPGATDYALRTAKENAIAPVVEKIGTRKAQKDREYQAGQRELSIAVIVNRLQLPYGATSDELTQAKRSVRTALNALDLTATADDLQATQNEVLAPIVATIHEREESRRKAGETQRKADEARRKAESDRRAAEALERERQSEAERRADSELSYLGNYLREFFPDDSTLDHWKSERELKEELRPRLVRMILDEKFLNDTQIRRWVRRQVEDS